MPHGLDSANAESWWVYSAEANVKVVTFEPLEEYPPSSYVPAVKITVFPEIDVPVFFVVGNSELETVAPSSVAVPSLEAITTPFDEFSVTTRVIVEPTTNFIVTC